MSHGDGSGDPTQPNLGDGGASVRRRLMAAAKFARDATTGDRRARRPAVFARPRPFTNKEGLLPGLGGGL